MNERMKYFWFFLVFIFFACACSIHKKTTGFDIRNQEFEGKSVERTIRKACLFFRENLNKNIVIEELAGEFNVGYSYFRQMFKKYTGFSPVQYHLSLRMQRAKDLMVSTDYSFKEIALELGFESYFYFSRVFRDKTGQSPKEFKNERRKK